jgi:hypothetical protein
LHGTDSQLLQAYGTTRVQQSAIRDQGDGSATLSEALDDLEEVHPKEGFSPGDLNVGSAAVCKSLLNKADQFWGGQFLVCGCRSLLP